MSELLRDLEGENLASFEALWEAVKLSDGFGLIVAVVDSSSGMKALADRLEAEGLTPAEIMDPGQDPLDQVLDQVGAPELGVVLMGFDTLALDREQLGRAIESLNWSRPRWPKQLAKPVVLLTTRELVPFITHFAPDFWRFHSLIVSFEFGQNAQDLRIAELRRRLREIETSPAMRHAWLEELDGLLRGIVDWSERRPPPKLTLTP